MLHEVKSTLGTVTERLQQILRTVRRDPTNAEITRVDLARASDRIRQRPGARWAATSGNSRSWRTSRREPFWVNGDLSHLQQAIENLLFNARDATFEMRNYLRDEAKREGDPVTRRQKLLEAAAWRGEVQLRAIREGNWAVLEVRDNGIGMTEEVPPRLPEDALHDQARQCPLRGLQRRHGPGVVVRGDGPGTSRGGTRDRVRPPAWNDIPIADAAGAVLTVTSEAGRLRGWRRRDPRSGRGSRSDRSLAVPACSPKRNRTGRAGRCSHPCGTSPSHRPAWRRPSRTPWTRACRRWRRSRATGRSSPRQLTVIVLAR